MEEKSTSQKLSILCSKSQYVLALSLARSDGLEDSAVATIHRQYGDHLYLKGDYDGAVQQFVNTLGHLQPSYVIRKVWISKVSTL
jgi:Tfp pilus assembly protein PilF